MVYSECLVSPECRAKVTTNARNMPSVMLRITDLPEVLETPRFLRLCNPVKLPQCPYISCLCKQTWLPIMDVLPLLNSFRQGCWITAVGLLTYALVCVISNVFFHPLFRFPGPRGAACTKWWLPYMMFVRGVNLSTLRQELHKKYGIFFFLASGPSAAPH